MNTISYCKSFTGTITLTNVKDIFTYLTCFLERSIIPLLFAIATIAFMWGIVKYIGAEDSTEKEQSTQFILWGIIGIAVMFSIWGLVNLLGNTFKVNGVIPVVPVTQPTTIQ